MAVFAIGATSSLQVANFTVTVLSVVCLLLVPAFLLMTHRGVDLVPLVLAALGWISFLASCLVNDVSVLWPNAIAPAAFALYLIGLTVLTGRAVDLIATVLAGIAAGTVVFFLTEGIELTHTGSFLDLWKYGIAQAVTILILFGLTTARVPPLVQPVVLALLGLASLGLNFRSHALVCLLAAATLFTHRVPGLPDPAWVAVRRDHRVRAGVRLRDADRRTGRTVRTGAAAQDHRAGGDQPADAAGRPDRTADDHHRDPGTPVARLGERHEPDAGVVHPGRASRGPDGVRPDVPVRRLLAVAAQRLLRDALDPVGFLGRRRRAGRAAAGVAVGGLHRHRLEPHAVRAMGSARGNCCPARDLGSASMRRGRTT